MNKTRLIAISIALAQLLMASGTPALASNAENDKPLVVGTVDNALPCSDHDGERYRGIAVDIWQKIAAKHQTRYQLVSIPTFEKAVDAAEKGKVDLVASCHTYNAYRLNRVEFSIPYTSYQPAIVSKREYDLPITFVARLFSSQRILWPAFVLLLFSWVTAVALKQQSKSEQTVSEISTTLLIGSGTHAFINRQKRSQIYLLTLTIVRVVLMSIIVGTAASIVFQSRRPDDLRAMNPQNFAKLVKEGLAIRSESSLVNFFDKQARKHQVKQADLSGIHHAATKEHMLSLLESKEVAHLLTSTNLAPWFIGRLGSNNYTISYEGKSSIPRGFLFGANLSQKAKQEINLGLAELEEDGSTDNLELFWLQNIQ